ncbi:MAG: peptidoglycan-associated lipoprotein Pal [Succinivibrionaceae bacterium]|nr:peptidoglycan-associated lipoprotein Pal [Succinivibrionaceae bacterium]
MKYLPLLAAVLVSVSLTACSSSNSAKIEDGSASGLDSSLIDESTLTVGVESSDNYNLTPEERRKFEALKQDNVIYFPFDSDRIDSQYVPLVQSHASFLRDHPEISVIIEGHTDERGTPEYNVALGERRARSVALYLQNLGVDGHQMSIVSYGEEKPAQYGSSEEAFARNRRAVFSY